MSVLGRRLILALLVAACPAAAWANISGNVFTTDNANPGTTNVNLYDNRQDVYVNGGPRQPGSAGLPTGFYHIQVTTPDGDLLGSSYVPSKGKTAPVIEVEAIPGGSGGKFKVVYRLWDIVWYIKPQNGQLCQGYLPTTNAGKEYKIWVSQNPAFPSNECKTDNFKVRSGPALPPQISIVAYKYYDTNGNANWDPTEHAIPNWQIQLKNGSTVIDTRLTDQDGKVEWIVPQGPTQYTVCEIIPEWEQPNPPIVLDPSVPDPEWVNTTPICQDALADQNRVVEFGNRVRYYQPVFGLGRTKGFWQNENGKAKLAECEAHRLPAEPHWWEGLNALNLVWPNGDPFTITANDSDSAHAQLAAWLVGVGAIGNPKYILGTQLAALWLNVNCGFMSGLGEIYFSFDEAFFMAMAKKMLGSAEDELGEAADLLLEDGTVYEDDMLDFADLFDDINNNDKPVYVETTGDALALLTAFKY